MPPAATPTRSSPTAADAVEDAPPRPLGRILSSRQFWDLMERWHIPDATALELIEFPGKLGMSGKRPRFKFTTRQQRITSYLPEIDAALVAAGRTRSGIWSGWSHARGAGTRVRTNGAVYQELGGAK